MTDPKRALTPLRAAHTLAQAVEFAVRDRDAVADLAARTSITTVEELVALSRISGDLLGRLDLGPAVTELVERYLASPAGIAQTADWRLYDERQYATGCALDLGAPPDAPARSARGSVARSASASLIDSYLSPIRDQARRGTCTAFAGVACLEYHEHRFAGHAGADLSEQFAYWSMIDQSAHHDLLSMFMTLRNEGACSETTWPYIADEVSGDDGQGPPPPAAATEAREYRAPKVHQLSARAVGEIKASLSASRPVAIGFPVYDSWFASAVVRKYGNLTVPLPGEEPQPVGHAVTLVGYADDAQFAGGGYFVVRNSWGASWASESEFGPGYGTIPYRYVEAFNWDAWCVSSPASR